MEGLISGIAGVYLGCAIGIGFWLVLMAAGNLITGLIDDIRIFIRRIRRCGKLNTK